MDSVSNAQQHEHCLHFTVFHCLVRCWHCAGLTITGFSFCRPHVRHSDLSAGPCRHATRGIGHDGKPHSAFPPPPRHTRFDTLWRWQSSRRLHEKNCSHGLAPGQHHCHSRKQSSAPYQHPFCPRTCAQNAVYMLAASARERYAKSNCHYA